MISQPNLCVAQIEYKVLNAALEYKRLPGECGNQQVLQFNPHTSSPQTEIDHQKRIM